MLGACAFGVPKWDVGGLDTATKVSLVAGVPTTPALNPTASACRCALALGWPKADVVNPDARESTGGAVGAESKALDPIAAAPIEEVPSAPLMIRLSEEAGRVCNPRRIAGECRIGKPICPQLRKGREVIPNAKCWHAGNGILQGNCRAPFGFYDWPAKCRATRQNCARHIDICPAGGICQRIPSAGAGASMCQ